MEFHVTNRHAGKRIDIQTAEMSGKTRSRIQNLISQGLLTVNGLSVRPNYRTKSGDIITLTIPEEDNTLIRENIPIEILYIDNYIAVVNKPPGMVVYPAAGHSRGTLMNALSYYSGRLASVGGPLRPGVVHRLDKDTSGVIVVALDDASYYNLVEQFRDRTINRRYKAIVYGNLNKDSGLISSAIGRSVSDRKKMSTRVRKGKEAVTSWKVLERFGAATLIEAKLGTGRTHQIRVHFASIAHPVMGDKTYGRKTFIETGKIKIIFPRQMLHAELLGFVHPITGQYMEFESEVPDDMKVKIDELRASRRHQIPDFR